MSLIFDKAWAEVASDSDEDERPAVRARKDREGGRALMVRRADALGASAPLDIIWHQQCVSG